MTKRDDGGSAYPAQFTQYSLSGKVVGHENVQGMTLRDWFAGQALVGMCANPDISSATPEGFTPKEAQRAYAFSAYEQADAMLEARNK